ncbi:MAG: YceI family protein [Flavobacteriales bacterium]
MKTTLLSAFALTAIFFSSCGESATTAETTTSSDSTTTYTLDVAASKVNWKGEVAGVYGHNGYVNFKSGSLLFGDSALAGGEFEVDMTGIYPLDSASYKEEDGHRATDLVKHLSTKDFFATDSFPTAKFVITSVSGNTAKGNLTVRGKTNEETLEIQSLENNNGTITAKGKLVFNRQKYDVAWVHFMKDMVLSDDIQLDIAVVAKK